MIKEPLDYGIRAVQRSDKQPDVDSDELYANLATENGQGGILARIVTKSTRVVH